MTNSVSLVLFSQAVEWLFRDPVRPLRKKLDSSHREAVAVDHLIKIGPHAALRFPIQEILENPRRKKEIKYLSTLYRKQFASFSLLQLLENCSIADFSSNCAAKMTLNHAYAGITHSSCRRSKVSIRSLDEVRSESPLVRNYRARAHGCVELLGSPSRDWNTLEPEHRLSGRTICPASAAIVMTTQSVSQITKKDQNIIGFTRRNIRFLVKLGIAYEEYSACENASTPFQRHGHVHH